MTTDRNTELQDLFDSAELELSDDAFTGQVMSEVDHRRRRAITGWIILGLLLLTCAWFLVLTAQDVISLVSQVLPATLIDVENDATARFLAPVNSLSGVFGLGLLALLFGIRKLFR